MTPEPCLSRIAAPYTPGEATLAVPQQAQATSKAAPLNTTTSAELTICSVAYQSQGLLDINHALVTRLNGPAELARWVVVENTPITEPSRLSKSDPRFELILGVKRPSVEDGPASLQHGKALNRALEPVKTRFVLLLDPDFFVIRPHWIRDVLEHMKARKLAFLGAPWHPRWYRKWRYFPCTHCLFIDLERVEREALDFTPDLSRQPLAYLSPFLTELEWMFTRGERLRALWSALRHWRLTLREDRRRRLVIGSTRDTGIAVYEKFSAMPEIRHETLLPVYLPHQDQLVPPPDVRLDTRSPLRETLELFRPDWLSFVPRRFGSFSRKRFTSFDLPDLHGRGWEEFLWRGTPFGFHVRNTLRAMKNQQVQEAEIREVMKKVSPAASSTPANNVHQ